MIFTLILELESSTENADENHDSQKRPDALQGLSKGYALDKARVP